eukprot:TRINITY_DN991_c0_g1_i11.p1 TRINITY_DN991_c0_g1~~TRINITY_DN991_c0_g1_i11.p1  ORF type:complete len:223 (+),score=42.59 TRINITY_DN991_c0_g1_i11:543-1211(+)
MPIYKNVEFQRWKADSARASQILSLRYCPRVEEKLNSLKDFSKKKIKFDNLGESKKHEHSDKHLICHPKGCSTPTIAKDSNPSAPKQQSKLHKKTQKEAFAAYLEAYKRAKALANPEPTPSPSFFPVYTLPPAAQNLFPLPLGEYQTGHIKFFDGMQSYGFFVVDVDGSDLFVHFDEFLKVGMTLEHIQIAKSTGVRFAFQKVAYYGRYNLSYKAVNIQILQ